jgi:hypothetical protein
MQAFASSLFAPIRTSHSALRNRSFRNLSVISMLALAEFPGTGFDDPHQSGLPAVER